MPNFVDDFYNGPSVTIDQSLTKLFQCMTLAYRLIALNFFNIEVCVLMNFMLHLVPSLLPLAGRISKVSDCNGRIRYALIISFGDVGTCSVSIYLLSQI